jgi:hypothetical protein
LNAALPLTLTAGTGTFSGSTFSSDPLPQSQGYDFTFHDAVNCSEVSLGGTVTCNCVTDAGSMAAQPDTACLTGMVTGQHNGDGVLDGGDVLRFVLQTGPGQPLGQVLAWNTVPVFGFLPGMQPGVTYYISAVGGDPDGSGNVSLIDPCLSVSPGQPVLFQPMPGAVLAPLDTNLCAGQPLDLTVNFAGTAPFSFVPVYGGMAQPALSNLPGPSFTWTFTPQTDLQVTLMTVGDRFCSGGTVSGTATVGLNAPPEIQALQVTCDNATATYALTFTAQNGLAPYTVSGLAGAFTGAQFTADPVPFGTPYSFQLADAFGCGTDDASGMASCGCMTVAGVMDPAPVTGCLSDTLGVPAATGTVLEPGDVLLYILHTAPGQPAGTILAWSAMPAFGFQPGMQPGLPYYISPIAGNPSGGLIDLNDPCLSVGTGTAVTWFAAPTATLAGNFDVCSGTAQPLTVMLTGTAPYSLSYTQNGQPTTTTALQNSFVINATLLQTSTFQLTAVQDAHCPGQASGQAVVTVHLPPEITGLAVTCAPDNQTFTVEFDVLNAGSTAGALGLGGFPGGSFDPVTGHFTGDPASIQDPAYAISVTDLLWGCGADSVSGSVVCNCITAAGTMDTAPLLLCFGQDAAAMPASGSVLEAGDTLLYFLVDTPSSDPASWTILGVSGMPLFTFPAGQVEPGTTYYIVAAAGDPAAGSGLDWNDPCLAVAPGPAVSWREPVSATISGNPSVCSGSSATLEISLSGSGPFTLVYAANGVPDTVTAAASPYLLTLAPTVYTDLELIGVSGAGTCPGTVGGSAGVMVTPAPTATLSGDTSVCAGGSAQLEIAFSGLPPFIFTYSRNGVVLPPQNALLNTFIVQATNVQQEQTFELLSVQNGQCPGTAEGTATIAVLATPAAALSGPATICAGDSAALVLTLTGADSFQLTILGGITPVTLTDAVNGMAVAVSPAATTTYQLSGVAASGNGCPVLLGPAVEVAVSSVTLGSVLSDYNGFNLSCPNSSDGSITLLASSPTPPFNALWDNGSGGLQQDMLTAGQYQVTVTDGAGCSAAASFTLAEPPELQVAWQAATPRCHGQSDGSIAVQSIQGGSGPFQLMLDGAPVMLADTFPSLLPGLAAGDYLLEVEDANGCISDTTLHLEDAAELWVDLGPDTMLAFGDSLLIEAVVSDPSLDTVIWTPLDEIGAPGGLIQIVTPLRSVLYEVVVRNDSGCLARDERSVTVEKQHRVFVPTVIRPGAALDANAVFTVYAGPEVRRVPSLRVYDRWGECVFEKTDLIPNDPTQGWRGRWREKEVPPGVYVYVVELEYFDGSTDLLSGDVTVVR